MHNEYDPLYNEYDPMSDDPTLAFRQRYQREEKRRADLADSFAIVAMFLCLMASAAIGYYAGSAVVPCAVQAPK